MAGEARKAEHTPGPYFWREFAQDTEDLAQMRSLGMTPTRILTNEGQVALMAGTGDDVKRIALIDCQTRYKRGEGYKTACAERDANAALFAAMPDLVKALEFYADRGRYDGPNQRLSGNDPHTPADQGYLQDVTRDGGAIARAALASMAQTERAG